MKLPPSNKLLKLCITQSLLQAGFQKTNATSLTAFTNVVEYLIFNLILKIKDNPADLACKILMENNDFSNDIFQLIKLCKGTGDSVLHVMNIIPKNIDWRGKGGGVKLVKEGKEVLESVYDSFVYDFIDNKEEQTQGRQKMLQIRITSEQAIDKIDTNNNVDNDIDTLQKNVKANDKQHDSNVFVLDNLALAITNKKGWLNNKDYEMLLKNKSNLQKYLQCYTTTQKNNLIEEFKFLSCKEVSKATKKKE